MKKTFCYVIGSLSIFSNGCTLYKKPEVPALNNPHFFKPAIKETSINLKDAWWENFNDEKLNLFVNLAIKNNYSYKIALKNIEIACTYVTQNLSNLFPQVNMSFNSSRNKSAAALANANGNANVSTNSVNPSSSSFSRIFNLQELTLSGSYQVDVWNQIRNSVKQAQANQSVSIADSKQVKLTIISSVVNIYFQIEAINSNLINLSEQLKSAKEIVQLYTTQYESGLIDFSTLDDAKNQVEIIKSNINTLEKQGQVFQYTLAYLCGEYPENFNLTVDNRFEHVHLNHLIPEGIPARMIANRPDIQEAYYQVLSAGYMEKQTIANFLPNISLTGDYGYASSALSNLISSANSYWNYGLNITQFVFDYKIRMSEYERANFQYQAAILNYKNAVINAFTQVDSALVSYKEDNEALLAFENQIINTKDKLMLTDAQYQGGLTDYTGYLEINLNYLQNEYNYINQKLAVAEDIVQVYVSLGLGI